VTLAPTGDHTRHLEVRSRDAKPGSGAAIAD